MSGRQALAIVAILMERSASAGDIATELHTDRGSVFRYLQEAKAQGVVYITGRRPGPKGLPATIYAIQTTPFEHQDTPARVIAPLVDPDL